MADFVRRFVRLGIFCPICHADVTCVRLFSSAENGEIAAMGRNVAVFLSNSF
jgi:uncharacterized membrane protein